MFIASAGSSISRCTKSNEETGKIEFSHNPFSMPQGGLEALNKQDPLTIKAFQYDIVCNGYELSSGAIRNHQPDIMYRAFEIAGYPRGRSESAVQSADQCAEVTARRRTVASPLASTGSSCCWPMSRIFAKSSCSR